jgi:kynureninase
VQPRLVSTRIQQYLTTWSTQGVFGHFKPLAGSPLPTWLDADNKAAESIAPIVGARTSEVAVMETLTANLHLLMGAFYNPDINGRHKIILESKAFPSDHVGANSFCFVSYRVRVSYRGASSSDDNLALDGL